MAYGTNSTDTSRQVGVYTGNILKGAKPAELPVQQAVKFDFVINRGTASARLPRAVNGSPDRRASQRLRQ